jgi:hypothetical protein
MTADPEFYAGLAAAAHDQVGAPHDLGDFSRWQWTQAQAGDSVDSPGEEWTLTLDHLVRWEGHWIEFGWDETRGIVAFAFAPSEGKP